MYECLPMFFRQTNLTDLEREAEYCLPAEGPGTRTTCDFLDDLFEVGVGVVDELDALLEDDAELVVFEVLTVPEFK